MNSTTNFLFQESSSQKLFGKTERNGSTGPRIVPAHDFGLADQSQTFHKGNTFI